MFFERTMYYRDVTCTCIYTISQTTFVRETTHSPYDTPYVEGDDV